MVTKLMPEKAKALWCEDKVNATANEKRIVFLSMLCNLNNSDCLINEGYLHNLLIIALPKPKMENYNLRMGK